MPESEQGGGEVAAEVDRLVRETRPGPDDGITVAFLGEVGSGRTVVAALVKHTLSTRWVQGNGGWWDALMVSGHDEINSTIRDMKSGLFPPPTVKDGYPVLRMELHRMKGPPSKIGLVLRDISGENYFERLSRSPPLSDIDGLLAELLKGDGAYIAHAAKYVLMIDCEKSDGWDTDEPRAVNMLRTIHAIKKRLNCLDSHGRIMSPVALVFTKADALPPAHSAKQASDLAGMYRDLGSTRRILHSGPLAYFKVQASADGRRTGRDKGGGPGGRGHDGGDGPREDDADDEVAPPARLAVPLSYSHRAYYSLITWLVDAR